MGQQMKSDNINMNYEMLIVADSMGVCSTNDGNQILKTNIKDRQYFIDVMSGKKDFVISDPVVSRVSGNMVVVIAVPIKLGSKPIGLIGGTVTCDSLSEMVKDMRLHNDGYSYIVQSDGLVIAHPEKKYIRQLNIVEKEYYLDAEKKTKQKKYLQIL